MKKILLFILLIILVIGLVIAQLIDDVIKETDKYKVTKTTLDKKEALHFELKKEMLATDLIKEAIKIQEEEKEK